MNDYNSPLSAAPCRHFLSERWKAFKALLFLFSLLCPQNQWSHVFLVWCWAGGGEEETPHENGDPRPVVPGGHGLVGSKSTSRTAGFACPRVLPGATWGLILNTCNKLWLLITFRKQLHFFSNKAPALIIRISQVRPCERPGTFPSLPPCRSGTCHNSHFNSISLLRFIFPFSSLSQEMPRVSCLQWYGFRNGSC